MTEFEKVAVPIGQLRARGFKAAWTPSAGLVGRRTQQAAASRVARQAFLQSGAVAGVRQARGVGKAAVKASTQRMTQARAAVGRLQKPGVMERVTGGRLGTFAKRQGRLEQATARLGGVSGAHKRVVAAQRSVVRESAKQLKPAAQAYRQTALQIGGRGISPRFRRAARMTDIAARSAIVGVPTGVVASQYYGSRQPSRRSYY